MAVMVVVEVMGCEEEGGGGGGGGGLPIVTVSQASVPA